VKVSIGTKVGDLVSKLTSTLIQQKSHKV